MTIPEVSVIDNVLNIVSFPSMGVVKDGNIADVTVS